MSDNKIELSGIFSEGYGIIPKKLMRMKINKNLKLILSYMLSFTGGGDTCFPGIRTIAADLEMSTTTITKYLKDAVKLGLIVKSKLNNDPMNHAHKYKLVFLTHDVSPCKNIDVLPTDTPDVSLGETTTYHQVKQNNNTINNNNDNKKNLPAKRRSSTPKDPLYAFGKDESGNPTLCQRIEDSFLHITKEFTNYGIERLAIKRIAGYAYKDSPEEPAEFCHRFLNYFYQIKKDRNHWLNDTPFVPSAISYNIYQRIKSEMDKKEMSQSEESKRALKWLFGEEHAVY